MNPPIAKDGLRWLCTSCIAVKSKYRHQIVSGQKERPSQVIECVVALHREAHDTPSARYSGSLDVSCQVYSYPILPRMKRWML
jgi:hypothetical protein